MRRRRTNIGRYTVHSRRVRIKRRNKKNEERAMRLSNNKEGNTIRSSHGTFEGSSQKHRQSSNDGADHLWLDNNSTSTKTPAEDMKVYRRKVKLKNYSIELNALLARDHSDVREEKTGDVQQHNKGVFETLDSQSEFLALNSAFEHRIKKEIIDDPMIEVDAAAKDGTCLDPLTEPKIEIEESPDTIQFNVDYDVCRIYDVYDNQKKAETDKKSSEGKAKATSAGATSNKAKENIASMRTRPIKVIKKEIIDDPMIEVDVAAKDGTCLDPLTEPKIEIEESPDTIQFNVDYDVCRIYDVSDNKKKAEKDKKTNEGKAKATSAKATSNKAKSKIVSVPFNKRFLEVLKQSKLKVYGRKRKIETSAKESDPKTSRVTDEVTSGTVGGSTTKPADSGVSLGAVVDPTLTKVKLEQDLDSEEIIEYGFLKK